LPQSTHKGKWCKKREEGRRKREEGRRKKEKGKRKREEGRGKKGRKEEINF
jgi:hypothetical protein